jgi:hypothetical protein
VTTVRPTPVPPGSWRLSLQELAERAGATVDRLERLVELDVVWHGSSDGIRFRRVGPVSFKGVSRDVVIYEAERA